MKGCISCKEAMRQCMDTHTFAFAHLYNDEKPWICTSMTAMRFIIRSPGESSF